MQFSENVVEYDIDLSLPESERWDHVIEREAHVIQALVSEAEEVVRGSCGLFQTPLEWLMKILYDASGGHYRGELKALAEGIGESTGKLTFLNCAYELQQLGASVPRTIFGCTTGVVQLKGNRLVQVRTLDWPLETMAPATRLFRFHQGNRQFITVGMPGFVGALSGMVPGAYSVCINWLPNDGMPRPAFGPAFLLRDVLESEDTFDGAVYSLKHTELSSAVSFTVCGAKRGEACVIERTRTAAAVRKLSGKVISQANHYVSKKFQKMNDSLYDGDDEFLSHYEDSVERAEGLAQSLSSLPIDSDVSDAAVCLDMSGVQNDETQHKMAFCPSTSEYIVMRRVRRLGIRAA